MTLAVVANLVSAALFAALTVLLIAFALRFRHYAYPFLFLAFPFLVLSSVCVSNVLERVAGIGAVDRIEEYQEILLLPFVLLFAYSWAATERLEKNAEHLKQLHHRVKNSLQVVESLVEIQAATSPGEAGAALAIARERIGVIGAAERFAMAGGELGSVDMDAYLRSVSGRLLASPALGGRSVRCEVEGGGLNLRTSAAVPCALILAEALLGAADGSGLQVALERRGAGLVRLYVSGASGLSAGFSAELVRSLAAQLGGAPTGSDPLTVDFPEGGPG